MFQGEGVAYRGRVLIELSTQLDDKTDKKVEDISNDDILVAQVTANIFQTIASWKIHEIEILLNIFFTSITKDYRVLRSQSLFLQNRTKNSCFTYFYCAEVPAEKEVFLMCRVPQCLHASGAWRTYSV